MRCTVTENRWGHLTIEFPGYPGRSLYLQTEDDRESFISLCGGDDANPEAIRKCPGEYFDVSEYSPKMEKPNAR